MLNIGITNQTAEPAPRFPVWSVTPSGDTSEQRAAAHPDLDSGDRNGNDP
jgi:hypothetical protein